jgi:hypothetical protein
MSINIGKAQAEALAEDPNFGGEERPNEPVKLTVLEKILVQYGSDFALELTESMKQKQVFGSGKLADSIIPTINEEGNTLTIRMLNYYDFPNKGVKGVKSSANAPTSPYQYKNFGMSKDGRKSISEYILSGRAKIRTVRNDKAVGIGVERKGVSALDSKVNTLIYLIKAYGIKTTNYFDDAFNKVFKDFAVTAAEAVGRDIVITIQRLNTSK